MVLLQSVIKAILSVCQGVKFIYLLPGCLFGQLYVKNGIGILACNLLKQFLRTNHGWLI